MPGIALFLCFPVESRTAWIVLYRLFVCRARPFAWRENTSWIWKLLDGLLVSIASWPLDACTLSRLETTYYNTLRAIHDTHTHTHSLSLSRLVEHCTAGRNKYSLLPRCFAAVRPTTHHSDTAFTRHTTVGWTKNHCFTHCPSSGHPACSIPLPSTVRVL